MLNPEIRDQAYQFFVEEAPELLQIIESGLLTLKEERNKQLVHEIMRAAHSIKGGAASVELDSIKTLAHRLEDIFKALYDDSVVIDTELETLLLQGYDCLRNPLEEQIETGEHDRETAIAEAEPVWQKIEAHLGDSLNNADQYIPSSADLGIDIVSSLFEVDVTQGLDHLATVAAHLDNYDVLTELQTQMEVFGGFAEMLGLPGFGEITQVTLKALELNPQQASYILQLALVDLIQAREQVLEKGDRTSGGSPSAALVAFTSGIKTNQQEELINSQSVFQEAEKTEDIESLFSDVPSLDDVFGAVIDESFSPLETQHKQQTPEKPSENLEKIIQNVESIFNDLPSVSEELPQAKSPKPTVNSKPQNLTLSLPQNRKGSQNNKTKNSSQKPNTPASNLSVKVDFNRLERMSNLVGELAINRNSLSLQNDQMQGAVKALLGRFAGFQGIIHKLQELSDQMLIAPDKMDSSRVNAHQFPEMSHGLGNFDSLEMDSYNHLYSLLGMLLEEMIQLEESVDDVVLFARTSNQTLEQQRQMLTNLRDELMWARMLPLGEVLNRFPRLLRDLSTKYSKPVRLNLTGTGVLVDKAALERLYDPLLHLLRNAFDHGIESPEDRQKTGKPEEGQIEIRAYHQGNQTIVEMTDDGKGLDYEKIKDKAIKAGIVTTEQMSVLSKERIQDLIFEPGFSTASQVSELSGRGVGLDVVRSQLRALKGTVSVTSKEGRGTTFILKLPLTLTIAKLLVCTVDYENNNSLVSVALPSDTIEEIIVPEDKQIKKQGNQRLLSWKRQIIPIYPFKDLLKYNCPLPERSANKGVTLKAVEDWGLPLLILRRGQQLYALEVSRLVTEQELVIKPFGNAIAAPIYTYGCTILGDGTLIPVVNGDNLIKQFLEPDFTESLVTSSMLATESFEPVVATTQTPLMLVVDDSAALRRTLALTLEKAGYRVVQARDGREALEQLQRTAGIDLVLCDIEMPNMNGFEFLGQCRRDPQMMKIPVAMLTSRSSEKHRKLAATLGASAYFTKPFIEQQFLASIANILQEKGVKTPVIS